jgi:hypothetical protein
MPIFKSYAMGTCWVGVQIRGDLWVKGRARVCGASSDPECRAPLAAARPHLWKCAATAKPSDKGVAAYRALSVKSCG